MQYFVISTDIVEEKIFSCMVVMFQTSQQIQDFSHLFYLQLTHFLSIQIQDLGIKNQKSQLQELRYSMNIEITLVYTQWRVHFVVMTKVLLQNITFLLKI